MFFVLTFSVPCMSGEKATKEDCLTKADEAVLLIQDVGRHAALNRIMDKKGPCIMDGWCRPGERLREQYLSTQFQVGRAPIREALRILEREGLICRENWKGAHIHKISPEEVAELMVVRESLCPRLMRLAVLKTQITETRL